MFYFWDDLAYIVYLICEFVLIFLFYFGTGTDVAGEVVEVGPGVQNFKPGDKVVSTMTLAVSVTLVSLI